MNGELATNGFPKFLALLEEDSDWCDPYPTCYHGKANVAKFFATVPQGTEVCKTVSVGPGCLS